MQRFVQTKEQTRICKDMLEAHICLLAPKLDSEEAGTICHCYCLNIGNVPERSTCKGLVHRVAILGCAVDVSEVGL
jgi:hypothetical protein